MVILLLIGIALAGVAVAFLARAVANPELRGAGPVTQIARYGFSRRRRAERSKAALGGIVERAADNVGERILATVAMPLVWIWFATTVSLSTLIAFIGTIACAYLGWALPLRIVKDRAKRRLAEVDYELPELIDLLVVTVEAGLGFVGSLQMASGRLVGPLGDELRLTLQEQDMGLSINEALAN